MCFFWRQGAIANAKGNRSNKKETIGYCNTLLQPISFSQTELEHTTSLVIITIILIAHNLSGLRSEDTTAKESAVRGRRWGCGTIWYKYIKSEGGKHIHEAQSNNGFLCSSKCHRQPTSPSAPVYPPGFNSSPLRWSCTEWWLSERTAARPAAGPPWSVNSRVSDGEDMRNESDSAKKEGGG